MQRLWQLLLTVGVQAPSEPSIDDLLRRIAESLLAALACDLVLIHQFDPKQQPSGRMVSASPALSSTDAIDYNGAFPIGAEPMVLQEMSHWLDHTAIQELPAVLHQTIAGLSQMHDGLVVPLWQNKQMWGELMVFWRFCPQQDPIRESVLWAQIAAQLMLIITPYQIKQQIYQERKQRRQLESILNHLQTYDQLTGLPNRQSFIQVLQGLCKAEQIAPNSIAVLLINLDRFRVITDSLGKAIGDYILLEIGCRLKHQLSSTHTVARWSEDQFAILLCQLSNAKAAMDIAHQLNTAIEQPFQFSPAYVPLTACIGIATNHSSTPVPEKLIQAAYTALHQAKLKGKRQILQVETNVQEQVVQRFRLESALHRALQQNELFLCYQPIVTLEDERLVGFEALMRWWNFEQGWVSPAEFIPLAEETGLIMALDQWGLRTACQQMKVWQTKWPNLSPLTMSVNLSAQHFSRPQLIEEIQACLADFNLAPETLRLEITEGTLISNIEIASQVLAELRKINIQVGMDDFGTGYSSLSYLHKFKLNTLKIDQSFITDLDSIFDRAPIIQAIITLAHALGMTVVAEGIETLDQKEVLIDLGCQYGQGFLFSRALDVDEATFLIENEMAKSQAASSCLMLPEQRLPSSIW